MGYSVDNIIPVNFILTSSGLGYADFSSAFVFACSDDLEDGVKFTADTFRDYSAIDEVAVDFKTDSPVYLTATRYFAQIPRPQTITVWMVDPEDEGILDTVNKANDAAWRYHYFFSQSQLTDENLLLLSDWADTAEHPIWATLTDENAPVAEVTDDIFSKLAAKGNRHLFVGWRSQEAVDAEESQAYSMVQVAAAFAKFRPAGLNTAITAEYQVLPGIDGDELKSSQYRTLKSKKAVFFTPVELAGQEDSCRVINSVSMSSYGEYIDDVINLDVLKNYLQVDGYNYIANVGTKRPLTPRGYEGLLSVLSCTLKRFYNNGVLGRGTYTDVDTGEEKTAEFGFVILSRGEDVLSLTSAQRKRREFPATSILVILARAGHVAELNITVE